MAPTIELIESITLSSTTATVTFSNIPQDYDDLYITCFSRTTRSSSNDGVIARFNGSSTDTNHSSRSIVGDGSSTYSFSQAYVRVGYATAATTLANTFGSSEMYISEYSGSNVKSMSSYGVQENNTTASDMGATAGLWNSTDPISSIQIRPLTGPNFTASSTFELYGIKDADDGAEGYFGPAVQGGDEVYTTGDGYKVHVFKNSGTLTVTNPGEVEYLVVAGGGSGGGVTNGSSGGGGGGAGGYRSSFGQNSGGGSSVEPQILINSGTYAVTIGGGGAAQTSWLAGNSGTNSGISSIVSSLGGGGGGYQLGAGKNGGSGGGGTYTYGGGSGTANQGYAGGSGSTVDNGDGGGGAGGIGGTGINPGGGGAGGVGLSSTITGSSLSIAGGGGGGCYHGGDNPGGTATSGGGAGGAAFVNGTNGTANTGGGGGGSGQGSGRSSGAGGSGIVIIRYKI